MLTNINPYFCSVENKIGIEKSYYHSIIYQFQMYNFQLPFHLKWKNNKNLESLEI